MLSSMQWASECGDLTPSVNNCARGEWSKIKSSRHQLHQLFLKGCGAPGRIALC
jgi:hypothetical protein